MPSTPADIPTTIKAAGYCLRLDVALLREQLDPADAGKQILEAELCETRLQLTLTESGSLIDLDLAQFGAYRIEARKARYAVLRRALVDEMQQEATHGPVLLHALACRGGSVPFRVESTT